MKGGLILQSPKHQQLPFSTYDDQTQEKQPIERDFQRVNPVGKVLVNPTIRFSYELGPRRHHPKLISMTLILKWLFLKVSVHSIHK